MQKHFAKHQFSWLTFLLAFAVLFYFYHEVLLQPNDFLFSASGDGIKNYYTYLFHARYDTGFSHFQGMNYPYFEHIVYTDAHPLLSWFIGQLGLTGYGIGILNFLMLLSYPVAAVFLFKILRHYKVNEIWAIAGAIAIAFLSPQVFRMTGHFSMSYVFAIPVMWWLIIQCYNGKKWFWSGVIALYMLMFFFTHPYLGLILAFFSIAFWCINMLTGRKKILSGTGHLLIQIALPLLTFQGYVKLTDTHVDRLSNPAGFFHYYASWKSLLVAHDGPLSGVYGRLKITVSNWESWCYIGFPTIIFALLTGYYLITKRRAFEFRRFFKAELVLFVIAAYLILLFAFCFPLKFDWLRWVADAFGPLKQFRVLGRFTWIFYYVFTVASMVGIYRLHKKNGGHLYLLVFFTGIAFYFLEFSPAHRNTANYITSAENKFKPDAVDPSMEEVINYVNASDYDAILFLPFQHMSSENIMLLGAEKANHDAFLISYHTNLPLVNSISSRMSLTEAIKVNNYFSPSFMEKEFTYDLPKDDRILIIKNRDLLKPSELRMIWESELLFENEDFVLFDFDPQKWNSRVHFDKVVEKEKNAIQSLTNGWRSDTTNVWFYYNGFDTTGTTLSAEQKLGGDGAFKDFKSSWNTLVQLTKDDIRPGDYVIRYWYYLRMDRPDALAILEEQYKGEKPTEWIAQFDVKQSTVIVADWCLVEMEFTVSPEMENLNILITGNGSQAPFIVDEMLIQKQNDPALFRRVTREGQSYIIYNNYWLKENSFE